MQGPNGKENQHSFIHGAPGQLLSTDLWGADEARKMGLLYRAESPESILAERRIWANLYENALVTYTPRNYFASTSGSALATLLEEAVGNGERVIFKGPVSHQIWDSLEITLGDEWVHRINNRHPDFNGQKPSDIDLMVSRNLFNQIARKFRLKVEQPRSQRDINRVILTGEDGIDYDIATSLRPEALEAVMIVTDPSIYRKGLLANFIDRDRASLEIAYGDVGMFYQEGKNLNQLSPAELRGLCTLPPIDFGHGLRIVLAIQMGFEAPEYFSRELILARMGAIPSIAIETINQGLAEVEQHELSTSEANSICYRFEKNLGIGTSTSEDSEYFSKAMLLEYLHRTGLLSWIRKAAKITQNTQLLDYLDCLEKENKFLLN